MSGQHTDAAERSAHVTRGPAASSDRISPVVEVAPGEWKLRAIVEAEQERDDWKSIARDRYYLLCDAKAALAAQEQRAALLAARLGEVEEERDALRAELEALKRNG